MNDQPQIDIDAINERLNSVSERARTKREEEERRRAEEEARLAEEREERLTELAAQLRDQLYATFAQVDTTDANSFDRVMNLFGQCQQVLSGEQSTPVATPVVAPAPASNLPFDWDPLSENQKKGMQLIADSETITGGKLAVLEAVITAPGNRFHLRGSDNAVIDSAARTKKTTAATPPKDNADDSGASAPEPERTPVPTPAAMPAKKTVAKKAAAPVPPGPPEPAPVSEPEPAPVATGDQPKGWIAKAKAAGKNALNSLD